MEREEVLRESARLENLGQDLGARRPDQDMVFPREPLLSQLARVLEGAKLNPVILGDSGVGKTALVTCLARACQSGNAPWLPPQLQRRRILGTTLPDIVAGALYANQLEHKVKLIVESCRLGQAILLLDDLPAFLGAGVCQPGDEADLMMLLVPFLRTGALRVIGATNMDGWLEVTRRKPIFARLFTPILVPEPDRAETMCILQCRAQDWKRRYGARLTREALDEALVLAERLYPWKKQPGKVCDLLEASLAVSAQPPPPSRADGATPPPIPWQVNGQNLCNSVQKLTSLPEHVIAADRPAQEAELHQALASRVVGQAHALAPLVERIQMIETRVCAAGRPLGAYLLAGPSGVGKTLVARALAHVLLGNESRLVRFDMSEFADRDSVARFVGEQHPTRRAPGLVDAALSEPFPVLLLDEIEKANPAAFDALLQVLGEGRLTDERGLTGYFTNALILMTTNLGADRPVVALPAGNRATAEELARSVIRSSFRPEFLNRLTAVLWFRPLTPEEVVEIARRELRRLSDRAGMQAKGLRVTVTQAVWEQLLREGYCPEFGARPMERAVDRWVASPVGEFLSENPQCRDRILVVELDPSDGVPRVGVSQRTAEKAEAMG